MTKLFVTTAHPTLLTHPGEHLGRLIQPRHTSSIEQTALSGFPWAADNDCFQGLDELRYEAMLDRIAGLPGCHFVTVPDVVRCVYCDATGDGYDGKPWCSCDFSKSRPRIVRGDAELTQRRFEEWQPIVEATGQPVALVAQDGLDELGVPWDAIDALFIGGSNDFKEGPAIEWARQARARGKWVHFGRVNTRRRFDLIAEVADSFDGSKWARWRKTYLNIGLSWCGDELARRAAALAHETLAATA